MATGLSPHDIYMGGPPVDNVAIDDESAGTLHYLAGLSALSGLAFAYWCMRQWGLTVLICTTAVYGVVALAMVYFTGNMMDAIMYSMPPVVYTAALSGAIHIINYYRATMAESGRSGAAGRALHAPGCHACCPR